MSEHRLSGSCLCGAVRFEISTTSDDVVVCHCGQCARWTGYAVASVDVAAADIRLLAGEDQLKWYRSSAEAERGFCGTCGSSLFWRPIEAARVAVLAGSLAPPTGLKVAGHIFVADKSDYYVIADGTPQYAVGPDGPDISNL